MIIYTNVETEEVVELGYELSRYEHSPLWERSETSSASPASADDPEAVPPNALKAVTVAQLDDLVSQYGLDVDPALKKPAKVAAILEALLGDDTEPASDGDTDGDTDPDGDED